MKPSIARRDHFLEKLIKNKISDQTSHNKSRTVQNDSKQYIRHTNMTVNNDYPNPTLHTDLQNEYSIITLNPTKNKRVNESQMQAKVVNLNDSLAYQAFNTVQQGVHPAHDQVYLKNQLLSLKQKNINNGNCNTSVSYIDTSTQHLNIPYDHARMQETYRSNFKRNQFDENKDLILNRTYLASDQMSEGNAQQLHPKRFETTERQAFRPDVELQNFQVVLKNRKADYSAQAKRSNTNKNVKFNMSMQLNPGEIGKFERRADSYFVDGNQAQKDRSHQISVDLQRKAPQHVDDHLKAKFGGEEDVVRNISSKHSSVQMRPTLRASFIQQAINYDVRASFIKSIQTNATTKNSSKLPSIFSPNNANTPDNLMNFKSPEVDKSSGICLITVRNQKISSNQKELKDQFMKSMGVQGKNFKKDINTKVAMPTQHNKYLRVRDGGWGSIDDAISLARQANNSLKQNNQIKLRDEQLIAMREMQQTDARTTELAQKSPTSLLATIPENTINLKDTSIPGKSVESLQRVVVKNQSSSQSNYFDEIHDIEEQVSGQNKLTYYNKGSALDEERSSLQKQSSFFSNKMLIPSLKINEEVDIAKRKISLSRKTTRTDQHGHARGDIYDPSMMDSHQSLFKPKHLNEFVPTVSNKALVSKQREQKKINQEIKKASDLFRSPRENMQTHRYKILGEEQLKKNLELERKERMMFNQHFDLLKTLSPDDKDKNIKEKLQNRRNRMIILEQIKQVQDQIKMKRKQIQDQLKENTTIQKQLVEQKQISNKLKKMNEHNISVDLGMSIPTEMSKINSSRTGGIDNTIDPYSIVNTEHENTSQPITIKNEIQTNSSVHNISKTDQNINKTVLSANTSFKAKKLLTQIQETDLQETREQTYDKISTLKDNHSIQVSQIEMLRQENYQLKSFVRRYEKLIKEVEMKHQINYIQQSSNGFSQISSQIYSNRSPYNHSRLTAKRSINQFEIEREVYKYGENMSDEQSNEWGRLTDHTPKVGQHAFPFASKNQVPGIELRKLETMTMHMHLILKQQRAFESMILHLNMIKNTFKAEKVTLFIINKDIQDFLFGFKREERVKHHRKIIIGNHLVYGLFHKEDDYQSPLFENLKEAGKYVFNNKAMQIPIKENKVTYMCLYLVYKSKMKVVNQVQHQDRDNSQFNQTKMSKFKGSVSSNSGSNAAKKTKNQTIKIAAQLHNGFQPTDFLFGRMLGMMMFIDLDYFRQIFMKKIKQATVNQVIQFGSDIINVKTFQQLVRKLQKWIRPLLGFEEGNMYFLNEKGGEFFAMVLEKNKDGEYLETTFNQDLQMGKDQVMSFPSTFGVSGDVHLNIGYKYDNEFGNIVRQESESSESDAQNFDLMRPSTNSETLSQLNFKNRGRNLIDVKKSHGSNDLQIIEEQYTPQNKNHVVILGNQNQIKEKSKLVQSLHSAKQINQIMDPNDDTSQASEVSNESRNIDGKIPKITLIQEVNQPETNTFDNTKQQTLNKPFNSKLNIQQLTASDASYQQVFPSKKMKKSKTMKNSIGVYDESKPYYQQFIQDIDNFIGVSEIRNYFIVSMRDDAFGFGAKSVGVLQLYNKIQNTPIGPSECKRLYEVGKLLGGLSQKCLAINQAIQTVIGLHGCNIDDIQKSLVELDFQTSMGVFDTYVMNVPDIFKPEGHQKENQEIEIE